MNYRNIGIEDIDRAIHGWFDNTVNVHVEHPGEESLKKVPVVFASGERWATAADERGIRDKNGVLILPIISVRRVSIEPMRNMSSFGVETNNIHISRRVSKKTSKIKNAINSRNPAEKELNKKTVYEVTTIPYPDFSTFRYEFLAQTQYISQMNTVLEKVFHNLDIQKSFVAKIIDSFASPDRDHDKSFEEKELLGDYYVVGFFNSDVSDGGNFEEFTDTERIVKYSTQIEVPVYLQLDPQGEKPAIQTELTAYDVDFGDERVCFVDNDEDIDKIFD